MPIMTTWSSLDDPLFGENSLLSLKARQSIIAGFWGDLPSLQTREFDTYFHFYHTVCRSQVASENAVGNHRHLVDLVLFLKQEKNTTRSQIRLKLAGAQYQSLNFQSISVARIDRSLNLAIRLWLMVGISGHGSFVPGRTQISWADDQTYVDLLQSREVFPKVTGTQLGKFHFLPSLTAYNVVRFGGIPIKWTCNLVDHLILNQQGQLLIYHPIAVLSALNESKYLPNGLVDETLRTIAILFPRADPQAYNWLQKMTEKAADSDERFDPAIGDVKTTSLEIETFEFWRHRLLVLEEAYTKSEPGTLWQWWHDRRNRREWATFWVAFLVLVLTILFGLIQSVTGVIQVVVAVKAFNIQNTPPDSS